MTRVAPAGAATEPAIVGARQVQPWEAIGKDRPEAEVARSVADGLSHSPIGVGLLRTTGLMANTSGAASR